MRAFVEHVSARWRARWGGYLAAFAPYLAVSFIAAAADFWSTYSFMSAEGVGDVIQHATDDKKGFDTTNKAIDALFKTTIF